MGKPIPKPKPAGQRTTNVGVAALARECGISEGAVSMKMKAGKTPDEIRAEADLRQGRMGRPPKQTPGRTMPHKRLVPKKPTASEYDMIVASRARFEELEGWKLRRQKALAERQEIENMLRRGELLPLAYVRTWASRFLVDGRDELLKGPSELADALAAEDDPRKIQVLVRAWVDRVIAKFEQLDQLWKGDVDAEQVA